MKPIFLCYSKCGTCKKSIKWLSDNEIDYQYREITTLNPSIQELKKWIKLSEKPISKFFNTSGLLYKKFGVKDLIKTKDENDLLELLSSDVMFI